MFCSQSASCGRSVTLTNNDMLQFCFVLFKLHTQGKQSLFIWPVTLAHEILRGEGKGEGDTIELNFYQLRLVLYRLRQAVSLFSWSVEQMNSRVTEGAKRERHDKREFLPFCFHSCLPPSFLSSRQRSRARVLPLLNLGKKRGCSQSTFCMMSCLHCLLTSSLW